MMPKRILVPTDFSESARKATDYALGVARAFGASLTLCYVIEDPVVYIPALGGYTPQPIDFEKFSEAALTNWIAPEDAEGVVIDDRKWEHGHPVSGILNFAKENEIDLIVLGAQGRSTIENALLGSVAERVVRKATIPVLTIHSDKAD